MFDLLDESGGGPHTLLLLFVIDFVRSWNEALVSWAGAASAAGASGAAGASKTAFNSVYSPIVVHASHCSAQTEERKNPKSKIQREIQQVPNFSMKFTAIMIGDTMAAIQQTLPGELVVWVNV